jgi:hypothetical protein
MDSRKPVTSWGNAYQSDIPIAKISSKAGRIYQDAIWVSKKVCRR